MSEGLPPHQVSPFSHKGGEAAKQLARTVFDEKKQAMGPSVGWPDDVAADDRWCSWMPDGWTPAVKMTSGEILIVCMVGPLPERKVFFHKTALEKHLGRKLEEMEKGKKPLDYGGLDPSQFLHRTDRVPATQYIKARCDKLHGYSVDEALRDFKYTHGEGGAAKEKQYTLQDLKYDVNERKNLKLVPLRPSQSANPIAIPATPATQRRHVPSTPSAAAAIPATPVTHRQLIPSTPAAAAAAAEAAVPATPVSRPAPSTPPATPIKRARTQPARQEGQSEMAVFQNCYTPLKSRAARGIEDEKSIYALLGLGHCLCLDDTMLKTLPEIFRRAPQDRGEFGQMTLRQFEKDVARTART